MKAILKIILAVLIMIPVTRANASLTRSQQANYVTAGLMFGTGTICLGFAGALMQFKKCLFAGEIERVRILTRANKLIQENTGFNKTVVSGRPHDYSSQQQKINENNERIKRINRNMAPINSTIRWGFAGSVAVLIFGALVGITQPL